jgi:fibro-slime domain-containing protein
MPDTATSTALPQQSQAQSNILVLQAIIRDFTPAHPDFEMNPGDAEVSTFPDKGGYGVVEGIVQNGLVNNKPVYAGNPKTLWTNGKDSFDQWFNDTAYDKWIKANNFPADVATTKVIPLFLRRIPGTDEFEFDSAAHYNDLQPGEIDFSSRGGFFPIDGELLGDYGDSGHNFHFTMEIHTTFTYKGTETFKFSGDDDLWVFINKQRVIDIGGVHERTERDLDLTAGSPIAQNLNLVKGQTYSLDLFYAERHTTEANCKITTSLQLIPVPVVSIHANQDADKVKPTQGSFTITMAPAPATAMQVNYTVMPGDPNAAVAGVDYQALSGSVMVSSTGTATIPVTPLASKNVNAAKPLTVQLKSDSRYQSSTSPATIKVLDRAIAALPTVTIQPGQDANKVTGAQGSYTVTMVPAPTSPMQVNYTVVAGNPNAAVAGDDYQTLSGSVMVSSIGTATIPVIPGASKNMDAAKPLTLQLQPDSRYQASTSQATIRVLDKLTVLPVPTVSIVGVGPAIRPPVNQPGLFRISLSAPQGNPLTIAVQLPLLPGGAVPGRDYTTPGFTFTNQVCNITFAPGQQIIDIPVVPLTLPAGGNPHKDVYATAVIMPNPQYQLGVNPAQVRIQTYGYPQP